MRSPSYVALAKRAVGAGGEEALFGVHRPLERVNLASPNVSLGALEDFDVATFCVIA